MKREDIKRLLNNEAMERALHGKEESNTEN
jgi:hypothetical protein